MTPTRRMMAWFVLVLLAGNPGVGHAADAEGPGRGPKLGFPTRKRGQEAIAAIGARLPEVAKYHRMQPERLKEILEKDRDLWVTDESELLFICEGLACPEHADAEETASTNDPHSSFDAPYPLTQTFLLHSRPGATKTIFLDFDGHTVSNSIWEGGGGFHLQLGPYYSSIGDAEKAQIQGIWARVAEDFAPFDVNVTTEDPGTEALRKGGTGDTQWGIRACFTYNRNLLTGAAIKNAGGGGTAYYNSFNWSHDEPALIFNRGLYTGHQTASHEIGHTLNLTHMGNTPSTEYYPGHGGTGPTSWAPIMGASWLGNDELVVQWTKGEYYLANNTQDELHVITTQHGFGYRADDYGNTLSTAWPLVLTGNVVTARGVIETQADVDFFAFTTGGSVTIAVNPFTAAPNLDILARLYDSSGTLIQEFNPSSVVTVNSTVVLTNGTYYLSVEGTGFGNPFASSPSGYTSYASLGQYAITLTVNPDLVCTLTAPANGATFTAPASITLQAAASSASEAIARVEFFSGATKLGEDTTSPYAYTWSGVEAGTYTLTARASDMLGAMTTSAVVNITVTQALYAVTSCTTNYTENGTNFTAHIFATVGTTNFNVTSSGTVEVLVVAGGGGGGRAGGGGGGGGLVYSNVFPVVAGSNYTVTVGAGGAGSASRANRGSNGSPSSFGSITATGGGGGGSYNGTDTTVGYCNGLDGGSGGGGAFLNAVLTIGTNLGGNASPAGQGYAGGQGSTAISPTIGAGGGGGAGAAGQSTTTDSGGNGGAGLSYSLSGTPTPYAGGGGGGGNTAGLGGTGGGGNGSAETANATAGTANTGGGGGGSRDISPGGTGGNGGSGIVIVRYVREIIPQQMQIAFDGYTGKSEVLTNFPVLVVLSNNVNGSGFNYSNFVSSSGYDLRFSQNLGDTTSYNYEIESWNPNGVSYVWVQVPTIPNDGSGYMWATWGNTGNSSQLACTTNGATWTNGYVGVWHMNQPNAQDSTTNRFHSISNTGNTNCTGRIGTAQAFNANRRRIQLSSAISTKINNTITIEAWGYLVSAAPQYSALFSENYDDGTGTDNNVQFCVGVQAASGSGRFFAGAYTNFWPGNTQQASPPPTGVWMHMVGVHDSTGTTLFHDGRAGNSDTTANLPASSSCTKGWVIGHRWDQFDQDGWNWPGYVDEVRLSNVRRSPDWIWACFMSQASNTVFNNYGAMTSQAVSIDLPAIANLAAVNITTNSAVMRGSLTSTGTSDTAVWVYWGPADAGTNVGPTYWAHTNYFGTNTVGATGYMTNTFDMGETLDPGTTYYYNFYAQNASGGVWAATAGSQSFLTLGKPVVTVSAASGLGVGTATLNGTMVNTNGYPATFFFLWGTNDYGGASTDQWTVVDCGSAINGQSVSTNLTGLIWGIRYWYRTYATSSAGERWSTPTNFVTQAPSSSPIWPTYRYYRFNVTANNGNNYNQVSELHYYLNGARTAATGGAPNNAGENNWNNANDNNSGSKFGQSGVPYSITYDFGTSRSFDAYNWASANDSTPARNPRNWTVQGSTDNSNWVILDTKTGAIGPSSTFTWSAANGSSFHAFANGGAQYAYPLPSSQGPPAVGITNTTATALGATQATLNGTLTGSNVYFDVWAYWGETDGTNNADGLWANTNYVGAFTLTGATISSNIAYTASTGIAPDKGYWYTLCARNAATNIWATPSKSFTSGVVAPAAPTGLTATVAGTNRIELAWMDNANDETGYVVARSLDSNVWVLVTLAGVNATNHSDTGLTTNTLYYYRVAASNAAGLSAYGYASATTWTAYEAWRRTYFTSVELGNPAISGDSEDPDHDNFSNLSEFLAGTIPTNRASYLGIMQFAAAPGTEGEYVVRWQSVSNKFYTLQAATNLMTGFDLILGTNIPATPPENVHTDNVENVGRKFYRTSVE